MSNIKGVRPGISSADGGVGLTEPDGSKPVGIGAWWRSVARGRRHKSPLYGDWSRRFDTKEIATTDAFLKCPTAEREVFARRSRVDETTERQPQIPGGQP